MAGGFRRLFQWRMRSLLILMALVGAGLAFWNSYVAVFVAQERAAESLKSFSAQLKSDEASPAFLAEIIGKERYHRVVECRLTGYTVDDEAVSKLPRMPYIERLYLATTAVGDNGLKSVSRLRNLQRLSLWRTRITDAGLGRLANCRNLRVLDLHDTCVTDEGLESLRSMGNLSFLKLGGPIHGPGLLHVAKLPLLRELDLSESAVGFEDLANLRESRIEELHLARRMPATVVRHLQGLPNLRDFHSDIVQADDVSVAEICKIRTLRSLSVSGLGVTDKAAVSIQKNLRRLERLTLHGDLTDEVLKHIAAMPRLDQVQLSGRFTRDAIQQLMQRQPSLTGSVRTPLFDASDYRRPQKIGGLRIEPLIEFGIDRYGQRTLRSVPESRWLHMWVHWPATLEDAAKWFRLRGRVRHVYFQSPPSLRVHDYHHDWSLKSIKDFPQMQTSSLERVAKGELARLANANQMREILLQDERINDEDIENLRLPQSMRRLVIVPSRVTPAGLATLQGRYPNVEMRENGHGSMFPAKRWQSPWCGQGSLDMLAKMPKLRKIQVESVRLPIDFSVLAQSKELNSIEISGLRLRERTWIINKPLKSLTHLSIVGVRVNDSDLAQLEQTPALEQLWIRDSLISDDALRHLVHVPKLTRLVLGCSRPTPYNPTGPWITGSGLSQLAKHCKQLSELDLRGAWVGDESLADLTGLPNLKNLSLESTRIGDEGCRYLASIPALEVLNLSRTRVTDVGLEYLAASESLKRVAVFGTKTTPEGAERLRSDTGIDVIQ